jgi:ADP-ribose pyrophosphatase YjhB (NUDIX family)
MRHGAFSVILKNNYILLVQSRNTPLILNHWSLPGGVVEHGESPEVGAMRDATEETRILCKVTDQLIEFTSSSNHLRLHIFRANYIGDKINIDKAEIA